MQRRWRSIVTGVSLSLLFVFAGVQFGFTTLIIAHISFCVPYVILAIMPKLRQIDQAKRDAAANRTGKLPAVFHKKNNHKILVTMELDDWMQIYREYQSGMQIDTERL